MENGSKQNEILSNYNQMTIIVDAKRVKTTYDRQMSTNSQNFENGCQMGLLDPTALNGGEKASSISISETLIPSSES